jgi:sialate O-acetylesterase
VSDVQISGSNVIVTFDHVADGLEARSVDSQPDAEEVAAGGTAISISADELGGFALCGADQVFYWATEAEIISSNQVRIANVVDVAEPVSVRYAWSRYPRCNLFNSEGLPAEPFRTDVYDFGSSSGAAAVQ